MSDLSEFHAFAPDGVRWRVVDDGVEIEGSGIERSAGKPVTVSRVWKNFGPAITKSSSQYGVPIPLIVATICTESSGKSDALRLEPGYVSDEATPGKMSAGLMQTLLSTARAVMKTAVDRAWLLDPPNSINAGTAYIADQKRQTSLDPPLVAAAYNAGRLRYQAGERNRWKLRQYPIGTSAHCDRFVHFYNDFIFAMKQG